MSAVTRPTSAFHGWYVFIPKVTFSLKYTVYKVNILLFWDIHLLLFITNKQIKHLILYSKFTPNI